MPRLQKSFPKDPTIARLCEKREDLHSKLSAIKTAIEAFQRVCDHQWTDDSHDSHYSYETCTHCGKTERA